MYSFRLNIALGILLIVGFDEFGQRCGMGLSDIDCHAVWKRSGKFQKRV